MNLFVRVSPRANTCGSGQTAQGIRCDVGFKNGLGVASATVRHSGPTQGASTHMKWQLARWPLGAFRCLQLPRNTHRCLRAIYMRSINPPKIEDLSRSMTLMQGIASLKRFIQFQTWATLEA